MHVHLIHVHVSLRGREGKREGGEKEGDRRKRGREGREAGRGEGREAGRGERRRAIGGREGGRGERKEGGGGGGQEGWKSSTQ